MSLDDLFYNALGDMAEGETVQELIKTIRDTYVPMSDLRGNGDFEWPYTVNRLEVIDHAVGGHGRDYVKWIKNNFDVGLSVQDEGRTLKVFLRDSRKK